MGVKLWIVLVVRFGLAALSGIVINLVWRGGGEIAKYGISPETAVVPNGWLEIFLLGVQKASFGVLQLALIVIPLMIVVQFLKDRNYLEKFSAKFTPVTKLIGVQPNASLTLVAGLVIGLAYGAGVMIQAVQEDGVSKRDATLSFIFLVACHAVIEDTLLFVPLGISVWPLLLIRVITAFVLTIAVAFFWRQKLVKKLEGRRLLQMANKITTVLFDLDGTLLDTNELIMQSFEQLLDRHYPGQYTRTKILPFLGPTLAETFNAMDPSKTEAMIEEYRTWNILNHDLLATPFDGVPETLTRLVDNGIRMAIVSTKRKDMVGKGLQLLGIGHLFETVIGLDDVKRPKPDPEPLLLAMQRMNVSKRKS